MHGHTKTKAPLVSDFADDPDMLEIVEEFVSEMPVRVENIGAAVRRGDSECVRRLAHQLKGAAGGYGFPTISESAKQVEDLLDPNGGSEPGVGRVFSEIESLINLCLSAVATPTKQGVSHTLSPNDGSTHG